MKGRDSSENKGYAFVTFRTKDLASKAIKELNNTDLKVMEADTLLNDPSVSQICWYSHAWCIHQCTDTYSAMICSLVDLQ